MRKRYAKYILPFSAVVIIIAIVAAVAVTDNKSSAKPLQQSAPAAAPTPSAPSTTTTKPLPKSTIFVTHTIVNPNQIPLRATIQARDVTNFDSIEIFVDSGSGYEKTSCTALPCEVRREHSQRGTVKYYAVATSSKYGTASDPAGAPASYKSFSVG